MTVVHVQLPANQDAAATRQMFSAGSAPDPVAYGFDHAETHYEKVTYSKSAREQPLANFLRRGLRRLLGFDIVHAWRNRQAIDDSDIVWTMVESDYLAVCALSALRPWRQIKPLIASNVWLFNGIDTMSPFRRTFYLRLARRASVLLTHSRECLPQMVRWLPDSDTRLMFFGVSDRAFPILKPSVQDAPDGQAIRIFAAGNDSTRDWKTLLDAFGNDERFEVTIICRWVTEEEAKAYGNVRLIRNPDMETFRSLYQSSDFTVVPMSRNRFSGITVALEAVACGGAVISSRTGGVPTYFSDEEVLFVEPGDYRGMRSIALATDPTRRASLIQNAQRRFVRDGYHNKEMVDRYRQITDEVLMGNPGRTERARLLEAAVE